MVSITSNLKFVHTHLYQAICGNLKRMASQICTTLILETVVPFQEMLSLWLVSKVGLSKFSNQYRKITLGWWMCGWGAGKDQEPLLITLTLASGGSPDCRIIASKSEVSRQEPCHQGSNRSEKDIQFPTMYLRDCIAKGRSSRIFRQIQEQYVGIDIVQKWCFLRVVVLIQLHQREPLLFTILHKCRRSWALFQSLGFLRHSPPSSRGKQIFGQTTLAPHFCHLSIKIWWGLIALSCEHLLEEEND